MAFSKLDARKHTDQNRINILNGSVTSKEEQLQLNGLKAHFRSSKFLSRTNHDYEKAFERYSEREPQTIKPKLFQKGKVRQIFLELEDEFNKKASNLTPKKMRDNEQDNSLDTWLRKNHQQQNCSQKLKNDNKQSELIDDIQQEIKQYQKIHHQNSYKNKFDESYQSKSDQNLKNVLKGLEESNSLSYDVEQLSKRWHEKSHLLPNNSKVKVVRMDHDESGQKSLFLPAINKKNRSYSPQRSIKEDEGSSMMDSHSRSINQQYQYNQSVQEQKQVLLIQKKEPYIIKKYKKTALNQLDEIIKQLTLSVCNPQSNSLDISNAIIEFISKVFSLRDFSLLHISKFSEIVENIHFCKKSNPLFDLLHQQIPNAFQQADNSLKVPYKDISLLLYNELVELKQIQLEENAKLIEERDNLLEKLQFISQDLQQPFDFQLQGTPRHCKDEYLFVNELNKIQSQKDTEYISGNKLTESINNLYEKELHTPQPEINELKESDKLFNEKVEEEENVKVQETSNNSKKRIKKLKK